jgi:hypothetical protein
MSLCPCSPDSLTAVTFENGIVLQRCGVHDVQSWVVAGETTDRDEVLANLRGVFSVRNEQRRRDRAPVARTPAPVAPAAPRSAPPAPEPNPTVDLTPAATAEILRANSPDEQLTALLQSRGLPGAWAVA